MLPINIVPCKELRKVAIQFSVFSIDPSLNARGSGLSGIIPPMLLIHTQFLPSGFS